MSKYEPLTKSRVSIFFVENNLRLHHFMSFKYSMLNKITVDEDYSRFVAVTKSAFSCNDNNYYS